MLKLDEKHGSSFLVGDTVVHITAVYGNRVEVCFDGPARVLRTALVERTLFKAGWRRVDAVHWLKDGVTKTTCEAFFEAEKELKGHG